MSKAFENSLDTQNFTIVDGYAKAILSLTLFIMSMRKRMSATSGLIQVLNIRQQKNISTTLKTSTALRLNVSKPARQFRLVAKSTVSRFFQSTSANRL